MRRSGETYPVRREQEWTLSPWSETSLFGPSLLSASPWQWMRRMQEDMDRLFEQFFTPALQEERAMRGARWTPSVDVSQDDREWLIEADLPGVSKDQIDVQVQNHHLVLRAEMRAESGEEEPGPRGDGERRQERQYQYRERRFGYFERVIPLPENVDEERIRCEFRDGVLRVHLPKTEEARTQGRRIPVGAEEQGALQARAAAPAGEENGPSGGDAGSRSRGRKSEVRTARAA